MLSFRARAAQRDFDGLDALAELGQRLPVERGVEKVGDVARGQAHQPRLVLIHGQSHYFRRLFPVQMDIGQRVIIAQRRRHFMTDAAQFADVRPAHPVLHWKAHRRAILQPGNHRAHPGSVFCIKLNQPGAQRLALDRPPGQHHELGKMGLGELLIERQVEARTARPQIGDIILHSRLLGQQRLQPLYRPVGRH